MNLIRSWALPRESSGPSTIALRTTWRYTSAVPFGPYPALDLLGGNLDNLRDHRSAAIVTEARAFLIPALCFCIVGIVGLIILGLWLNDRSRYELLLLGINCIALPPIYLNYVGIAGLLAYPAGVYFTLWAVPALGDQYLPHIVLLCTRRPSRSLVFLDSDCYRDCDLFHYGGDPAALTGAIALA